jgi:hypothetical protein
MGAEPLNTAAMVGPPLSTVGTTTSAAKRRRGRPRFERNDEQDLTRFDPPAGKRKVAESGISGDGDNQIKRSKVYPNLTLIQHEHSQQVSALNQQIGKRHPINSDCNAEVKERRLPLISSVRFGIFHAASAGV